jgi:hypothetical protein
MPYEVTLQALLRQTDNELYCRLPQIERIARTLLIYTQGKFPYYTPHDFHHSATVEENLNWLIPDKIKEDLNAYETFFLICAAWLHDWGMIGNESEDPIEIRENHHIRSETYLETMHDKIGLSLHEGRIVGRICKGHRKVNLHSVEYDDMIIGASKRIRTRFLSALLRIADEADITHSRTPEVIYYTLNPTGKSEEEFSKHLHISGIGQLDEPYKIYVSAIARDPKGAQTLRDVASKIQKELDTVKSIISHYGLFLDIVELQLETRGFIDKPIAFEVDRKRIVDLLVGKHLYGNLDAAIRELVQNSIDACNLRKVLNADYAPQINLIRKDENTLVISDNGIGMGFAEAKRFLSNVGSSFYKSEDFKTILKNKSYDPISNFGIGLLSAFLIADSIEIETKKYGEDACKFSISSHPDNWKYEKGSLMQPGTLITLQLNSEGRKISLLQSLKGYVIATPIPINYQELGYEPSDFVTKWCKDTICTRFLSKLGKPERIFAKGVREVTKFDTADYDVILVRTRGYFDKQLLLFSHGVFVNGFSIEGISNTYCVFLNLKKPLIDLHISRENVIENIKWRSFLFLLFNSIFDIIRASFKDEILKFVVFIADIVESRISIDELKYDGILEAYPFLHSILTKAQFPIVCGGVQKWATFAEILQNTVMDIYNCTSFDITSEIEIFCKLSGNGNAFFNPYRTPYVGYVSKRNQLISLIDYSYMDQKGSLTRIDLRSLIIKAAKSIDTDYNRILPSNVQFASFGEFKPIVVVLKNPKVSEKEPYLGSAYWGNILLWHQLIDKDRHDTYSEVFRGYFDERYECITLLEEPVVLIDYTDPFISLVISKYNELTPYDVQILRRYFKYLSYFPLVVHNLESCLIFIEVIDCIEKQLSENLDLQRPEQLFSRMGSISKLYLKYLKKYGIAYDEL